MIKKHAQAKHVPTLFCQVFYDEWFFCIKILGLENL